MFKLEDVSYAYDIEAAPEQGIQQPPNRRQALCGVTLQMKKGEWWAILGANGSGKSTLARHLNGLLPATSGRVEVCGREVRDYAQMQDLRRLVGIVFQNPDNQIVGNSVEEDVAFGLENLGTARPVMRRRISEVLKMVGLSGRETVDPAALSGGQKQRLAIAGALAMQPQALILDEATSMLDPVGQAEVLDLLQKLHGDGLTVVMITHNMSEVLLADKVAVMSEGRLMMTGTPAEIFAKSDELQKWHIELPLITQLGNKLGVAGCTDLAELLQKLEEMAED